MTNSTKKCLTNFKNASFSKMGLDYPRNLKIGNLEVPGTWELRNSGTSELGNLGTCLRVSRQFSTDFDDIFQGLGYRPIFESRGDYREIFIEKYYIDLVQKLAHLTCSKFQITTSLYN